MSGDISKCHNWGVGKGGWLRVLTSRGYEARHAIKHPTMHSTSHNKVFGANVNSFEVEKLG